MIKIDISPDSVTIIQLDGSRTIVPRCSAIGAGEWVEAWRIMQRSVVRMQAQLGNSRYWDDAA